MTAPPISARVLRELPRHIVERIELQPSGCWEWRKKDGSRHVGYSEVTVNGKHVGLHRLMWQLVNGPIPADHRKSMCICHHCDNPPCCNPEHLFVGTDADNMADRRRKVRAGTRPARADVLAQLVADGEATPIQVWAHEYGRGAVTHLERAGVVSRPVAEKLVDGGHVSVKLARKISAVTGVRAVSLVGLE